MTLSDLFLLMKLRDCEPWHAILRRDPCTYCGRFEADVPGGDGRKWRCGGATKMTIEHVVPRGLDLPRPPGSLNKVAACWNCNHQRNNLPLLAYLLYRQMQAVRFLPGPNNARNRIIKAEHRARKERQRNLRVTNAPGLRWSLAQAFDSERQQAHGLATSTNAVGQSPENPT